MGSLCFCAMSRCLEEHRKVESIVLTTDLPEGRWCSLNRVPSIGGPSVCHCTSLYSSRIWRVVRPASFFRVSVVGYLATSLKGPCQCPQPVDVGSLIFAATCCVGSIVPYCVGSFFVLLGEDLLVIPDHYPEE